MARNDVTRRFMEALSTAEQSGDVGPLCALFAEDATLRNGVRASEVEGREGARAFWQEYLSPFSEIRSTFTEVIDEGGHASLEWRSEGTLRNGRRLTYTGVSLLTIEGDRVVRFQTYYEPGPFLPAVGADGATAQPPG